MFIRPRGAGRRPVAAGGPRRALTALVLAGLLTLLPLSTASAAAAVTFDDPAFAGCVAGALAQSPTRPVTLSQARAVTRLHCDDQVVSRLGGIESFTNLTSLDLDAVNQVSDLRPLAGLTRLQQLSVPNGRVADLTPLQHLTALTRLEVSSNPVRSLGPLASLTGLRELGVGGYQGGPWVSLAPLTHLRLTTLSIGDGDWTTLEPLRGMTSLRRLTVTQEDRAVGVTALGSLTGLRQLDLEVPKVADVSAVGRLTGLTDLTLVSGTRDLSALRPLVGLVRLSTTLPNGDGTVLAGKPHLAELDLVAPSLRDLNALVGSPGLTRVSIAGTHLRDVRGLAGHASLTEVTLTGVDQADLTPLGGLPRLEYLSVSDGRLDPLRGFASGFPALRDLQLQGDRITSLQGFRVPPRLASLDVSSNALRDLSGLSCDLVVNATGQRVWMGRAIAGQPYRMPLRSVPGQTVVLAHKPADWTVSGTTITYARPGTYRVWFGAPNGCYPGVTLDGVVTQTAVARPSR